MSRPRAKTPRRTAPARSRPIEIDEGPNLYRDVNLALSNWLKNQGIASELPSAWAKKIDFLPDD
jgi:hypothetical protein